MISSANVDPPSAREVRAASVPRPLCLKKRVFCSLAVLVVVLALSGAVLLLANRFHSSPDASVGPPSQVALAAGNFSDTEVTFTWLTDDTRDDASSCEHAAVVEISGMGTVQKEFECLRYQYGAAADSAFAFGTNYTSGRIHRVRVGNLKPDTTYHYSLKGDKDRLHRTFRTLPAPSSRNAYPLSFGVIGDLGQTSYSLHTVRQLDAESNIRMILHAGDMSYADSNAVRWDSYGEKVEFLASRTQWMVCPGNHEIESDTYTGYNFVPYEARFAMPRVRPAVNKPALSQRGCGHPWPMRQHPGADCTPSEFQGSYDWGNSFYAFTAGPARIISLNPYTDTSPGSPQYTWLKAELAALKSRRAEIPWLIVQMHCPFYNSNTAHQEESQTVSMRDAHGFEDLFFENQVSIVLTGHVHAYERTFPVYRKAVNPKGPSYIVIGDGGNREGHAKDYITKPPWSAFRNGTTYGHGKITLINSTHMWWEWKVDDASWAHSQAETAAGVVADMHGHAGSLSAKGSSSLWHSTLHARTAEDATWIVNPWSPIGSGPAEQVNEFSKFI